MSKRGSEEPRWLTTLVVSVAGAFLAVCAARLMFGVFMLYDDEGYVLLSLRNFVEKGGLYRDIFSQYGPFPFVFHWLLTLLGFPLTHAGGRFIALAVWVLVAFAFAGMVARASRSVAAALGALTCTFACLYAMTSEPSHPGGIIVTLVAIAATGGWALLTKGRLHAWAALAGAVTGALVLTKVNVGAFAAFAAAAWIGLHLRDDAWRRPAIMLLLAGCVALPLGLMRDLLAEPRILSFAREWAISAVAMILVLARNAERNACPALFARLVAASLVMAGIVIAVPLMRGSDSVDLWEGIVAGPLRNSVRYYLPPDGWWGMGLAAAASLGVAVVAALAPARWRERVDTGISVLRIATAAAVATTFALQPVFLGASSVFSFILPCLWLFAWPLAGSESHKVSANAWILLLLLGQTLHAYPVAGSQVAWGCVLLVPAVAIGAAEAAAWISRTHAAKWGPSVRSASRFAAVSTTIMISAAAAWPVAADALKRQGRPLVDLPGSGPLRQRAETASLLQVVTMNAVAHADILFSAPGMFSFNLWSGVPTPTGDNVTHWFSLLNQSQQEKIIQKLEGNRRSAVILHTGHLSFLKECGFIPHGPLIDFIAKEFVPAFRAGELEFHVRRGRTVRPFLLANLFTLSPQAEGVAEKHLLRVPLFLPVPQGLAGVEIQTVGGSWVKLGAANARIELAPLSPHGEAAGPATPAEWPAKINGPTLLSIYFDHPGTSGLPREAAIILRAADGGQAGLARLAP